jgi:hypothetical protein
MILLERSSNSITSPNLCPLDDLLRDHFLQGVLKNMKGASEPTWDYEDALGDGMMDLSRLDIWGGKSGQLRHGFNHTDNAVHVRMQGGTAFVPSRTQPFRGSRFLDYTLPPSVSGHPLSDSVVTSVYTCIVRLIVLTIILYVFLLLLSRGCLPFA